MAQKKDNLPVNPEPVVADGGSITYANEVIAIISGIAASEIDGIAGMVTAGGLGEIISRNRNITRGVKVEVGTEEVSVDLYTIIEYGQPIQKVAAEVQENVRKSIESMTGLRVVRVDIHVQGVSFEKDKKDAQNRLEAANVPHISGPQHDRKGKKAPKAQEDEKPQAIQPEGKPEELPQQSDEPKDPAVLNPEQTNEPEQPLEKTAEAADQHQEPQNIETPEAEQPKEPGTARKPKTNHPKQRKG